MSERRKKWIPTGFQETLVLAEFQSLRKEIELQIIERRKVIFQHLLAVFVIYAWLGSMDKIDYSGFRLFMFMPIVILVVGFVRWAGIMIGTIRVGQYIQSVENAHLDGFG